MKNIRRYDEYVDAVLTDEFSIGNMLPQVTLSSGDTFSEEDELELRKRMVKPPDNERYEKIMTESKKKQIKNNKGKIVPDTCPKCGSPVKIFFRGEPVFLCSNKKCNKFFGVVPFHD